jgi:hypothetical protein
VEANDVPFAFQWKPLREKGESLFVSSVDEIEGRKYILSLKLVRFFVNRNGGRFKVGMAAKWFVSCLYHTTEM